MTKRRQPIVIERVAPVVDDGRHPVKRVVGEPLVIAADIFKEGHDVLAAAARYRARGEAAWRVAPLVRRDGDRWAAELILEENTRYTIVLEAWTDRFGSWVRETERRVAGGQADLRSELLEGRALVEEAAAAASGVDAERLRHALGALDAAPDQDVRLRPTHWGPLQHERFPVFQPGTSQDIGLWFVENGQGLVGGLTYSTDILSARTAARFHQRLVTLL